ncbi:MAG: sigma-54 dependent transcriptional regulator [Steroidobacteraceae bacterium]
MNNSTHTRVSESGNDPVSNADATRRLFELARRVAQSNCTVLITGESGTGKEVLARHIHLNSPRASAPFIAVNCAAIPEHMLEAVLFGWERGAFTGAHQAHAGKFEQAQGGTLLLDEISEMPLGLQAKLLRVLQEHEVERLGGREPIALQVRVLATSNRRLREEVSAGRFREDLYYRLNVFPLALAPLRGRRDDILPLAMRMLANHSPPGARIPALQADAARLLLAHEWPGNVRELENVMQRALVLCEDDVIGPEHISFELTAPQEGAARAEPNPLTRAPLRPRAPDLADSLAVAERQIILDALKAFHGSRQRVAEKLGISPRTLRYKLARLRAAGVDLAGLEQVA